MAENLVGAWPRGYPELTRMVKIVGAAAMARKRTERDRVQFDIAWPLADAKARLSELIDKVEREGPQVISKHGREVAIVVPIEEWRRRNERKGSLAEFLAESPLRDSGVVVEHERRDSAHRDVIL
ncbi:type II toxin-antitoxin system Phd/YefM family antitoxin [Nocardia sp. NPDC052566]|uniref:type II toxin-antitoxin system Phd/YefM family antitoxin n=1 Tax=Nocardia sp. NPDC052566 TaxID=3364330 RepID=UPI0037CABAAB